MKKKIVITGGASGFGLAMATAALKLGHDVAVCSRTIGKLEQAKALHPALNIFACDIVQAADRERLLDHVSKTMGVPDVLINNAAVCYAHDLTAARDTDLETEILTNLLAPVALCRLALNRYANARPITLVNVSTAGAFLPLQAIPLYSASKAGLHSFTESLRAQCKGMATVVELFPPTMSTGLVAEVEVKSASETDPAAIEGYARKAIEQILRGKTHIYVGPGTRASVFMAQKANGLMTRLANRMTQRKISPEY